MEIDVKALRDKHIGFKFDERDFTIQADKLAAYAKACGETESRFTDPEDSDFRAVPNYTASFHGRKSLPEGFPIDLRRSFDAGKCVDSKLAIRVGDQITSRSHIHDIYEKTGRSGPMMFVVHRMEFSNQRDELVSVVDWRLVVRLGDL